MECYMNLKETSYLLGGKLRLSINDAAFGRNDHDGSHAVLKTVTKGVNQDEKDDVLKQKGNVSKEDAVTDQASSGESLSTRDMHAKPNSSTVPVTIEAKRLTNPATNGLGLSVGGSTSSNGLKQTSVSGYGGKVTFQKTNFYIGEDDSEDDEDLVSDSQGLRPVDFGYLKRCNKAFTDLSILSDEQDGDFPVYSYDDEAEVCLETIWEEDEEED